MITPEITPVVYEPRDETLVIEVHNAHTSNCGIPPAVVKRSGGNRYVGYFENTYGEQWVLQIDRATKTGTLRSGDVGWQRSYAIQDDRLDPNLILSREEAAWLINCWLAATGSALQVTTFSQALGPLSSLSGR